MASPEVCRALPTMTWSISSGAKPLRSSALLAAMAARSMALTSLKWPLYSAIGVLAPFTMTISFMETPVRNAECRNGLNHSAFFILPPPGEQHDGGPLHDHHPHARLNPEPPAGEPFRAA